MSTAAPTILIVDDTPANIGLLVDALEGRDFRVAVAQDGEEALQRAQRIQPDLVLLDIMMPGIDGFETCRRLKMVEGLHDVPVIFMTALSFTSDKVSGFEAGAVDYVTKPFQVEEVLARIDTHLALRRMRQEIIEQNRRLQESYAQLQASSRQIEEMQRQLLQAEKMAAIGQLAAGVAHEINNPIGFVSSNLAMLRRYLDGLLQLVEVYERTEPALDHHPELRSEIAHCKQAVDLDFLREDAHTLLSESLDGAQRISRIVQDLRAFSRVGEAEWQEADLHAGIDNTLRLLAGELGGKIDLRREYGNIPRVECVPAQLNQVFLKLLMNAIQAVSKISKGGTITIRTGSTAETVWVEIEDNGCGITSEHLGRIFEPFYTTREVGQGSGLGLALAYGIMRRHGGRIDVKSVPDEGTTFTVRLPIRQK